MWFSYKRFQKGRQTTGGGISLLASRLLLRAPMPESVAGALGGDGGSWFISARRSYFDQVLRPVADFPYHLTDVQTYASVATPLGGRVALTGYWGEDVLDLSSLGSDGGATDVLRLRWKWGNRVIGATWLQPLDGGWSLDSRIGYSRLSDPRRTVCSTTLEKRTSPKSTKFSASPYRE